MQKTAIFIAGSILLLYGLYLVHPALAFMCAGMILIAASWGLHRQETPKGEIEQ